MDIVKTLKVCDLQHILTIFVCLTVFNVNGSTIIVPAPGFSKEHSSYTYVTGVLLTRQQAAYACDVMHGGYLVRINTDQEEADMISVITELSIDEHFWIGLQWTRINGSSVLVWDDGSCTDVDLRDNYHDDKSKVFDAKEQCFVDHGKDDLLWEKWLCTDTQHYVCQNTSISFQPLGVTFHVIMQNGSNATSCQEICLSLIDCFLASAISNACVVGLATEEISTYVIRTESIRISEVLNETTASYYKLKSVNATTPPPCTHRERNPTFIKNRSVKDYNLLALNETTTPCAPCSQQSTPVSTVYVSGVSTVYVTGVSTVYVTDVSTVYVTGVGTTTRIVPTTVVAVSSTPSCTGTQDIATKELVLTTTKLVVMTSTATTTELVTSTTTTTELTTSTLLVSSGCPQPQQIESSTVRGEEMSLRDFASLLLDKSNTSRTRRKKISAENKVISSVIIGSTLTVFFLSFVALFIVADFGRLLLDLQMMMLKNIQRLV